MEETPELLTDDMDIRDTTLSMFIGNNGDYYVELKETKNGEIIKLDTRIAMSGGNSTPEIKSAVVNLFRALMRQKTYTDNKSLPDINESLLEKREANPNSWHDETGRNED